MKDRPPPINLQIFGTPLDLRPEPRHEGEDWFEPLWRYIEAVALTDPFVYRIARTVRTGDRTREAAIVELIVELLHDRTRRYLEELERLRNAPSAPADVNTKGLWRGRRLEELTREELIDVVLALKRELDHRSRQHHADLEAINALDQSEP